MPKANTCPVRILRPCECCPQAFDEDLGRFLSQGIIGGSLQAEMPEIISVVKSYLRRERIPLLERIDFYNRLQEGNESFHSFFTSLLKLFNGSNFYDITGCRKSSPIMGPDCSQELCLIG